MLKADEVRADEKEALRKKLRAERDALPASEVQRASAAVCARVASLGVFSTARTVGLYAAIGAEVDVSALFSADKTFVFPRVTKRELTFHIASFADLTRGNFGVPEPSERAPLVERIDLIVVPAIAFDRTGHRIGYGKGYFDRALARLAGATRVGVCHDSQLIARVPIHDADQAVDFIVTPSECIATGARKTFGATQ